MSGPLELYRTNVNLRGLGAGSEIEIDPSDPGWAGDIRAGRLRKVEGAPEVEETPLVEEYREHLREVVAEAADEIAAQAEIFAAQLTVDWSGVDQPYSEGGVAFGELPEDDR